MKATTAGQTQKVKIGHTALPILLCLIFSACGKEPEPAPVIRPVRSVIVEKHDVGDPIVVTGHLRARDEVNLAFRLSGKMIERKLDVGDKVTSGQLVARLDDELERNARSAAQADLIAAQAALEQSEAFEKRQQNLLASRAVSRNEYDLALRQLRTSEAQVNAAKANLSSAEEQLGYTQLKSEVDGVITEKGAEPGEVVQAGQMILTVAQQSGRDAVFDMPAQVIREGLSLDQEVEVWLADNSDITAAGKVREISPQADPITRNYQVKVEVRNPPSAMFLGATVVGRLQLHTAPLIEIPSPALTMVKDKPAVWVVDSKDMRVHRREISVVRYTPDSVVVKDGLQSGERIVTAGVQELHEDQAVKLLGEK